MTDIVELLLTGGEVSPEAAAHEIERLRSDCLTLALRLYSEPTRTMAPETQEVMNRWRPKCELLMHPRLLSDRQMADDYFAANPTMNITIINGCMYTRRF